MDITLSGHRSRFLAPVSINFNYFEQLKLHIYIIPTKNSNENTVTDFLPYNKCKLTYLTKEYHIRSSYTIYTCNLNKIENNCTVGADLAERGAQETSSIVVETVQKISKSKQVGPVLPLFKSDASKVTSKGMGLKKAYLGKQNVFTVNASDAGDSLIFFYISECNLLIFQKFKKSRMKCVRNVSFLLQAIIFSTLACTGLKDHATRCP